MAEEREWKREGHRTSRSAGRSQSAYEMNPAFEPDVTDQDRERELVRWTPMSCTGTLQRKHAFEDELEMAEPMCSDWSR